LPADNLADAARLWTLDPGIAHLNHGSYGATPRLVQEARQAWLRRIEASPERFFRVRMHDRLAEVRATVARFLGIDEASLALVGNVTEAIGVALRAVPVRRGSNIVISSDCYPWVALAVEQRARAAGAEVRTVGLPAPGPEFGTGVVAGYVDAIDDATALAVIDQITSPTALRLPVEALIERLRGRVPVLVDAAHSPGLEPEPVAADADFWVASLHKWTYAPRGASVLVAADPWHERVEPLVVSEGTQGPFPGSFDYLGTRDHSALLAIPAALTFPQRALGLTWPQLTRTNVESVRHGVELAMTRLGATTCGPVELPMATLQLPVAADPAAAESVAAVLRQHGVEVATSSRRGRLRVRLSAQPYVAATDYERFCDTMIEQVIRR
jgi:isopenicillin-N epimerase